jgi:hypothetical protein
VNNELERIWKEAAMPNRGTIPTFPGAIEGNNERLQSVSRLRIEPSTSRIQTRALLYTNLPNNFVYLYIWCSLEVVNTSKPEGRERENID